MVGRSRVPGEPGCFFPLRSVSSLSESLNLCQLLPETFFRDVRVIPTGVALPTGSDLMIAPTFARIFGVPAVVAGF